jgi:hypothetical protein
MTRTKVKTMDSFIMEIYNFEFTLNWLYKFKKEKKIILGLIQN